jgi:hypothetical protein
MSASGSSWWITAQPKDFEEVRTAAVQSMFSWQMDLPGK